MLRSQNGINRAQGLAPSPEAVSEEVAGSGIRHGARADEGCDQSVLLRICRGGVEASLTATAHGEAAILRDAAAHAKGGMGLAQVLATLAAILLGFAIMTFVASNCRSCPIRCGYALLFRGRGVVCGNGVLAKGYDAFGHAAVLAGVAAFGASIMLIGQRNHPGGYPPHAVAMWATGALLAAVLARSNAALALAMVLVVLWGGWEFAIANKVYWEALIGWAAVSAAFYVQRRWPGVHLSGPALTAFVIHAALLSGGPHRHDLLGVDFVTGGWISCNSGSL